MPSDNVDEPFRSSRTAPKWLPYGVGKGLSPYFPSRCKPVSQGWLCQCFSYLNKLIINISYRLSTGKSGVSLFFPGNFVFPVRMHCPSAAHLPQPMQWVGPP